MKTETLKNKWPKIFCIFCFLIIFIAFANASFLRSYLTVGMAIAEDGSVDVREEIRFFMDSSASVDLYRISLKATNDLAGWRERMKLNDIRYHVDTSEVQILSTRLQPTDPDTCDFYKNTCYGTFIIEYKIKAPIDGKGIVDIKRYVSPRIIEYNFKKGVLLFETTTFGEQYLPELTTLEIKIPTDSRLVKVTPIPAEYVEIGEVPKNANKFTWHGRILLSGLELKYEKKESLLSEVTNFFSEIQKKIVLWATSSEGTVLISVAIILIIAYIAIQKTR